MIVAVPLVHTQLQHLSDMLTSCLASCTLCKGSLSCSTAYHFNIDCVTRVDDKLGSGSSIVVAPVDSGGIGFKCHNVGVDTCVAAANCWDTLQRPIQRSMGVPCSPRRPGSRNGGGRPMPLAIGMHTQGIYAAISGLQMRDTACTFTAFKQRSRCARVFRVSAAGNDAHCGAT